MFHLLIEITCEVLAQQTARDEQVLAGHHLGDIERGGDFSVSPLFEIMKQHHLLLGFAELLQRSEKSPTQSNRRSVTLDHIAARFPLKEGCMELASLEVVEGAMPDRLEEPTREVFWFAALIQPLQRSHQCLLCKVFSVGGAAHYRQRHRVGGAQITSD